MDKLLKAFKSTATVAPNVIFAFLGYVIAAGAIYAAKKYGVSIPDQVETDLPGAVAVAIAHLVDVYTGENKEPPCPPTK